MFHVDDFIGERMFQEFGYFKGKLRFKSFKKNLDIRYVTGIISYH